MAAKVPNGVGRILAGLLLAALAFLALYVIGYSMVAVFGHGGFESRTARAVGAGIAAAASILLLALYFSSPPRPSQAEISGRRYRPKRAA
jgi:hypothetical protein